MFVDEVEGKHGKLGDLERQWISENLEKLADNEKLNILRELENYKVITLKVIKEVYTAVTGKKCNGYYWAVCLECGCEYDYSLPMCPACYEKKLECRARAIKTSEFQPPMKVVRYNKTFLKYENEHSCFNCENRKESYCPHFGNPYYNCNSEELHSCGCNACCSALKSAQRKVDDWREKGNKQNYAKPLSKEYL
jgi:hypothetical protein